MSNPLNPLLEKTKLPGKVFQLPSKGLFYAPGVLASEVRDAEIQVKPMSALTELKIKSPDLLFSAKILREVCVECAPEILRPEDLISRDVDALFTFLVSATYGNEKTIRAIHTCEDGEWHDYTIDLGTILANPRNESLINRELLFQTTLPNDQVVFLKPVTFLDSIELMTSRQEIARKESLGDKIAHSELEVLVLNDMMAVMLAVETGSGEEKIRVTERKHILEWLKTLPKKYTDQIANAAVYSAEWGFDFRVNLKCKDCNEVFGHDLELNPINFFSG